MKSVYPNARTVLAAASTIAILGMSAQSGTAKNFEQEHPRRAQVIHRDQRLNNRINDDRGHLNGHYGQLKAEDHGIRRQERNDARNNGGFITRGQQGQMNREETDLSKQTYFDNSKNSFTQDHPRRAQVLGRAYGDQEHINADEGHLNGHYGQLMKEDKGLIGQEQNDARSNGGHITRGQQRQLNNEETDVSKQTYFDNNQNSFVKNHPGRAQVLGRAYGLGDNINADEGKLGGHYGQLRKEDQSIMHQEQTDAAADHGHITGAERYQLNQQESSLKNQMKQDFQ